MWPFNISNKRSSGEAPAVITEHPTGDAVKLAPSPFAGGVDYTAEVQRGGRDHLSAAAETHRPDSVYVPKREAPKAPEKVESKSVRRIERLSRDFKNEENPKRELRPGEQFAKVNLTPELFALQRDRAAKIDAKISADILGSDRATLVKVDEVWRISYGLMMSHSIPAQREKFKKLLAEAASQAARGKEPQIVDRDAFYREEEARLSLHKRALRTIFAEAVEPLNRVIGRQIACAETLAGDLERKELALYAQGDGAIGLPFRPSGLLVACQQSVWRLAGPEFDPGTTGTSGSSVSNFLKRLGLTL